MSTLNLKAFPAGDCIEIDDVMRGFRKLAVVTEGGDMYFDLAGSDATPFPIYEALQPTDLGNSLAWGLKLADTAPAEYAQYVELESRLRDSTMDTITANRALYWATQNHDYDFSRAAAAGRAATTEVQKSRAMMDSIIHRAARS